MKIRIIAIGRCRDPSINAIADTYLKRIKSYVPTEIKEVDLKRKSAGQRLEKIITPKDHLIALDERGKTFDSIGFSTFLQQLFIMHERIVFLIGDAEGLPPALLTHIKEKLSLSPMTLQHDITRVVFLEQLYRALTILKGEPYHK